MEEARQHTLVTSEQRLFAWIYHVGTLVLVVSICLQIFRRIDALYPALLAVGCTRIGLSGWQLARPNSSKTKRTEAGLIFNIVVWASAMLLLVWARRYGAGT